MNPDKYLDAWILGLPFNRAYFSIYDLESGQMGFIGMAADTRPFYTPTPPKDEEEPTIAPRSRSQWSETARVVNESFKELYGERSAKEETVDPEQEEEEEVDPQGSPASSALPTVLEKLAEQMKPSKEKHRP